MTASLNAPSCRVGRRQPQISDSVCYDAALLWATLSTRTICVAFACLLWENISSFTKPEVHNLSSRAAATVRFAQNQWQIWVTPASPRSIYSTYSSAIYQGQFSMSKCTKMCRFERKLKNMGAKSLDHIGLLGKDLTAPHKTQYYYVRVDNGTELELCVICLFVSFFLRFLPRDATQARYMLWPCVRLSVCVCHKSVFC